MYCPLRNARHGLLYTWQGIINIKNAKWKKDYSALDKESKSLYSRNYSKAYVRHLVHCGEWLGAQICSIHNLSFFIELVQEARQAILDDRFPIWKVKHIDKLRKKI